MPVTDEQIAALRAFLAIEDETERLVRNLMESGDATGYGELVYAAFVAAVRRRFSPIWSTPEVIRFVATARADLMQDDIDIDPHTAETLIRRALGDSITIRLDEEARARAQIFLLLQLIDNEEFDDAGLDAFLAQVRSLADQLVG
jgi:hypothetical protein